MTSDHFYDNNRTKIYRVTIIYRNCFSMFFTFKQNILLHNMILSGTHCIMYNKEVYIHV